MNLANAINSAATGAQAFDAETQRLQDRAQVMKDRAVANEQTQAGLEDFRRNRAGQAEDRAIVSAAPDIATAQTGLEAGRLKRGDLAGANQAQLGKIDNAMQEYKKNEADFQVKMQPIVQQIKEKVANGSLKDADAQVAIQSAGVQDQFHDALNKQLALVWQTALLDKPTAIEMWNGSQMLRPGEKMSDIQISADGTQIAQIGEDGKPLRVVKRAYLDGLVKKYIDQPKVEKIGDNLVSVTPSGAVKELYKSDTFKALPSNSPGLYSTSTGETKPAPGGGGSGNLSRPQLRTNEEIDAARSALTGMSHDEVLRKTQTATATGRNNPEYDPRIASQWRLANRRKYGADEQFDQFKLGSQSTLSQELQRARTQGDISRRFNADLSMRGRSLGKITPQGQEVLDSSGKLVGHYN